MTKIFYHMTENSPPDSVKGIDQFHLRMKLWTLAFNDHIGHDRYKSINFYISY